MTGGTEVNDFIRAALEAQVNPASTVPEVDPVPTGAVARVTPKP